MKFRQLLEIVDTEPVFDTSLLLVGDVDPQDIHRQLSRWTQAGWLHQLRRGLYALAPPFQKVQPHPFVIANRLAHSSYVSCQAGLAYCHLIPEYVPVVTSVTTGRPGSWTTPLGRFDFQHIKTDLLYGYQLTEVQEDQHAFVATPEKALLDLIYLSPEGDSLRFLAALRLHNLNSLDIAALQDYATRAQSPKLRRAAEHLILLAETEAVEYETL